MKTELDHRREIVRLGRMLHDRFLVSATDGNLSVKLAEERILATPTGMSKGMMSEDDLVIVDRRGTVVDGARNVSSEIGIHLLIYRLRPDVGGIVHAHPPTATGFAAAGLALDQPLVSEVVINLGGIPLALYGTPGTPELAASIEPLVPMHDAILLANHGAVTCGRDLLNAFLKMETVEHFARIALTTHLLGRQCPLTDEQTRRLAEVRDRYLAGAAERPLEKSSGEPRSR
ncbi:MAG: class II aldolase/adducin family protein [Acidobacteria bacterium]|nr:class II aldolase/adducin family protein [Acidobacteriota bacterium]